MQNFFSTGGSGASIFSKSSKESTLDGIWRNTAAMPFFWLKKLARKRETLGNFVAEIDVAGFFEMFDLVLRRDLVEHRLERVVFQRRKFHALQFAVDAQNGRVAGGQMQVRGFLLEHQIEERVNFCHTGDNSGMSGQELYSEQFITVLSGVTIPARPFRKRWGTRRDFALGAPEPVSP